MTKANLNAAKQYIDTDSIKHITDSNSIIGSSFEAMILYLNHTQYTTIIIIVRIIIIIIIIIIIYNNHN